MFWDGDDLIERGCLLIVNWGILGVDRLGLDWGINVWKLRGMK